MRQRLQVYPYTGAASVVETYAAPMSPIGSTQSGQLISRSERIYCDQTAAAGAENTATVSTPVPGDEQDPAPLPAQDRAERLGLEPHRAAGHDDDEHLQRRLPHAGRSADRRPEPCGHADLHEHDAQRVLRRLDRRRQLAARAAEETTASKTAPNSLGSITPSAGIAPKATATAGP